MNRLNDDLKFQSKNWNRGKCRSVVYALLCCVVLCSCQANNKQIVDGMNKTTVQEKQVDSKNVDAKDIPSISSDRLIIEGDELVGIKDIYKIEENLVVPKNITKISKNALKYDGDNPKQTKELHVNIPTNVELKEENFRGTGKLDITFEEGRKVIQKGVFKHASDAVKVKLPMSCEKLEDEAFCEGTGLIVLNEGLTYVGKRALASTKCDLPDSIEILEDEALYLWHPAVLNRWKVNSTEYTLIEIHLPDSLKKMGKNCLLIDTDIVPRNNIFIPVGVESIGKNAITYVNEKQNPADVTVSKNNKWYYADSKCHLRRR
ncbi:leucine-rich repeat protein [Eubacterium xylanophilum]|uniref:leucine-rich repeat protein n=1 Tax=Eubacterium xylanophilum TaxID=39497 RepID=UPI00047B74DA|nr:leucine-rich repeat protein [Eubacterium xylanophilum]